MRKRNKFREGVLTVGVMCGVTFVCIAVVSSAYLLTGKIVRNNERFFLQRAVMSAAGLSVPADTSLAEAMFQHCVRQQPGDGPQQYAVVDPQNGTTQAYVLTERAPGLWGEITAVIGFGSDRRTVKGIEFIEQNETPGLGARITEGWFKAQFIGKHGPFTMAAEGTAQRQTEFDAITGATITSRAVQTIVNLAATQVENSIPHTE